MKATVNRKIRQVAMMATAAILAASNIVNAQTADGNAGINQATTQVKSYFATGVNLMYAIGAVMGLVGAIKVYSKWNAGHRVEIILWHVKSSVMVEQFRIKIMDKEFVIDDRLEMFQEVSKGGEAVISEISISHFRYKDGGWYILWDKAFCDVHNPTNYSHYIPLTVEWVEVSFLDNKPDSREQLDLIIMLSETLKIIRSRCPAAMKKSDKLKKFIILFNQS